ncbi:MAG: hypothetical protein GWP18_04710 [Proteobacteria bacterium]|nr:hypothetical protein [Pseudomonadota bacterium]
MPISADELKSVMSRVAATVTVATAKGNDGPVGLAISSFTSVSADPAIVLVCIDKKAGSLRTMLDAEGFTVNVMPQGAEDETMLFATAGADKFASSKWRDADHPTAGPILETALAHLECVTIERTEVGDHWVIYGEVLATELSDDESMPLVWCGRGFARIGE